MAQLILLAASAVALGVAAASAGQAPERSKLWAGISVSHPVFKLEEVKRLQLEFALINDTEQAFDPQVARSVLVVNGQPLKDSDVIFASGPRDERFERLPAGDSLRFSYRLGEHFGKPGLYRLRWKGVGFESAVIEFRVLSK